MWSCESTPRTFPHAYRRPPGGVAMRSPRPASAVDRDFAVGERLVCVLRDEQEARATRGPPAGEEVRRGSRRPPPPPAPAPASLGEQLLGPTADVAQLGGAPRQHRDHGAHALRRPQEVGDGMYTLREDVGTHARLVVEQRALVRVGGGGVHARPEIDEDARVAVFALDYGGGRVGPEPGRVYQVVREHDADLASPLERGQGLVERAADAVVVGDEARSLTGSLEEVREGVGAVFEGAHDARGCGNRHNVIITQG